MIYDEGIDLCDETHQHNELLNKTATNMPGSEDLYHLADFFKVFGDSTRLRILFALYNSEMCVCDIAELLQMTQSAISHQLKTLKQAKLVKSRRDGKSVLYSLDDQHIVEIIAQAYEHIREK